MTNGVCSSEPLVEANLLQSPGQGYIIVLINHDFVGPWPHQRTETDPVKWTPVKDSIHVRVSLPELVTIRKIVTIDGEEINEMPFRQTGPVVELTIDSIRITRQLVLLSTKSTTVNHRNTSLGRTLDHNGPTLRNVPDVQFIQKQHHFGRIVAYKEKTHVFKLRNAGIAPLRIIATKCSASDITASYSPNVIEAGSSGEVRVKLNPSEIVGQFVRIITIESDDPTEGTTELRISGNV
ncbi:MAG: DUF1573 domain-containing protein, partial [Bacteroidales bacterium]|nr:DUF1573 domain-containing protein [Bacteroidales bacterium]